MANRTETDSMGPVEVPGDALYGAQTQRAVDAFRISGQRFPRRFLWALGHVKLACARVNHARGDLSDPVADAVCAAAQEVIDGRLDAHFPLDLYQTGSGTSTNMNANEVIANRAAQRLGQPVGGKAVHPNDDVNRGQSSNDVIPTALHVAGAVAIEADLLPALRALAEALDDRARAFDDIVKSGRTHLMDATPIRLGQEVSGWAAQVHHGVRRATAARDALLEVALGGTAVGTGLNRAQGFPDQVVARLAEATGLPFRRAINPFEAQGARDGVVEAHGQLNTIATSLHKIANDIRLLGSGPRTGLAELVLPEIQPGSSIMPGKVNPVMCEMLVMVCARVVGNQTAITLCGMTGQLQLNAMLPLLAHSLLESVTLLASGAQTFADRCITGLQADRVRIAATVERNLSLGTALAPVIGYDAAAAIAKEALASDRSIRAVALERGVLDEARLDALLDPATMTRPG